LTAVDVLLVLFFGALAVSRIRHMVWFGFVALVVCARLLAGLPASAAIERRLRGAVLACTLAALCVSIRFGNVRHATFGSAPSTDFSPPMVAELSDPGLRGNVLNSLELGAELVFRDWPRLAPSIDTRVDAYGDAYFEYTQRLLHDEPALVGFLDAYRVDHMLLLKRDFDHAVRQMPVIAARWHIRFADGRIFLLERNVPSAPAR
jgi:hypothetical protein